MREINEPVRIAYAAALTQLPDIGVYYQYLPNNLSPDNYVVFRSLNSSDGSTKDSARLHFNITVEIHTKQNIGNQGISADSIADAIFQLIYPDKHTNLVLSRGRIIWTRVSSDTTLDFVSRNQFGFISRYITFNHEIAVNDTGSDAGGGGVTTQGQVFRLEYAGIGGEAGFTNINLVTKKILDVSKDGISFSQIITSGVPTDKQVLYMASTGGIVFDIPLEPDEQVVVLYQLLNTSPILTYQYTATGGESSFSAVTLEGKNIVKVSVDGVDASYIIYTGSPVNKEALYETLTGTITLAIPLEAGQQVKVLYQL